MRYPIPLSDYLHMKGRRLMDRGDCTYCCRQQEAFLDEDDESPLEFQQVLLHFYTLINHRFCQRCQSSNFEAVNNLLLLLIQFAICKFFRKMIPYNILI
ncbi:hypothetical protein AHAS_Ahas19G0279300 [Arachis hypogaea]